MFKTSAVLSAAPGDFVCWPSTGESTCFGNQTCYRQIVRGRKESSRTTRTQKNASKTSSLAFEAFFLCTAARKARRAASGAGLVRERWQALKPVGGKARSRSGDNAASFGSFLGCRKERLRPAPTPPNFFLIRVRYQLLGLSGLFSAGAFYISSRRKRPPVHPC